MEKAMEVKNQVLNGTLKLLYVAPERFVRKALCIVVN